MARDVESLVLQMSADVRRMERELQRGQRAFDKAADSIERRQRQLDKKLATLGAEAANFAQPIQLAATVALGAITAMSYQAAKRAEAVSGAFEQTFRDMPQQASDAVAAISDDFKRLETDIKDNFTQLRSVLTALGVDAAQSLAIVDQLQRRALDIAAFRDVSDAEAFRAVISGITGETEPLKRFGIVLNETAVKAELLRLGFKGNAEQASEAAKSIARTNIIMRQSAEMHGQVSREADTVAEKEKRARAEFVKAAEDLGQKFLPVAADLIEWASDALDAFNKLPEGVQAASLALLALIAVSGPIAATIKGLQALIAAAVAARGALAAIGNIPGGKGGGAKVPLIAPIAGTAALGAGLLTGVGSFAPAPGPDDFVNDPSFVAKRLGESDASWRARGGFTRSEWEQRRRQQAARPVASASPTAAPAPQGDFGLSEAQAMGGGGGRGGRGGSGGARSGPSAEDLANQRAMLALQGQIELLRAQGREADARSLQMQVDRINLEKQYADAGVANAREAARIQVEAVANAEAEVRARETAAEIAGRWLDMAAEASERNRQDAEDELGFRAEIARLSGDETGLRLAQERLYIEQRTNELLALRPGLSHAEAQSMAKSESDQLRAAEIIGGLGGQDSPVAMAEAAYAEVEALRQQDLLSEEEAARRKAQIAAEYNEARLANTRGMLDALATLQNSSNKKLAALGKAAAIAQATMDMYLAIQAAWRSAPFPANLPAVAITTAATAANVAAIAGMADGGVVRGVGGPREDNQLRRLSVGEFVVNARATEQNRALLEAINAGQNIGRMANGGMVGVPQIADLTAARREPGSSFSYSPTIDARGADMAAARRIESILAEHERTFADRVNAVRDRRAKYQLGTRRRP